MNKFNSLVKISFELFNYYAKERREDNLRVMYWKDFDRFAQDCGFMNSEVIENIFLEKSSKYALEGNNHRSIPYSGFYESIEELARMKYKHDIQPYSRFIESSLSPLLNSLNLFQNSCEMISVLKPEMERYKSGLRRIYKYYTKNNMKANFELTIHQFEDILNKSEIYPLHIRNKELIKIIEYNVNNTDINKVKIMNELIDYSTPHYLKKPKIPSLSISFNNFVNILIHLSLIIFGRGIYKNKYEYENPKNRLNAMINSIKRCYIQLFNSEMICDNIQIPNTNSNYIDTLHFEEENEGDDESVIKTYISPKPKRITSCSYHHKSYYQRPSYFNNECKFSSKDLDKENKRRIENNNILNNHKIISPNELQNESIDNSEMLKPQYYVSYKDKSSQEMMKELSKINIKTNENKTPIIEDEGECEEMNEIESFLTPPKYYSSYKLDEREKEIDKKENIVIDDLEECIMKSYELLNKL